MEDYVVRYGNEFNINRSFYMSKEQAEKFYLHLELDVNTTWKELLYEPINEEDTQYILKSSSVKVIDLGLCKVILSN